MGASGSRTAVAPILPATQLSASQVAEAVKALGTPYAPYAEKLQENGIDGAFLESVTTDDLPGLLADIEVTSGLHQKKLKLVFNSFKSGGAAALEPPEDRNDDIFLSLRFGEAITEAKALRQAIAASGESAFICEVAAGEDIKAIVIEKLVRARLVVVFGPTFQ